MDEPVPQNLYLDERRRRLAAERTLDHMRRELARAHSAPLADADRMSRRYLAERDRTLTLTERQRAVLAQGRAAAARADRARRRLWHALEAMRDGFAVFDAGGHLVAANPVYLDLFDGAGDLGPGAHATRIFRAAAEEGSFDIGDLAPGDWAAAQVARWDAPTIPPLVLQHCDGRVLRFQDRRAPDGDVVSLAIDVTEDRDRAASLAAARDAAEQVARAKSDFLARMGHEIRTPMNGVLGLARMLADQAADPEAALCARTIRDSAEALLTIVNDTLDVTRLEAGRLDLRDAPFDLEAVLCDCLRLAAASGPPAVATGLSYPLGARTAFRGDAGRIRQIVMNLLGNALKFTETGHVILRATIDPDRAGAPTRIALAVEDTGPGIPESDRATVFEAFGQVRDPARPAPEGAGLGLTISRGLAERMGGTLVLDGRAGPGATFTLSLPLRPDGAVPGLPALPPVVAVPAGGSPCGDLVAERLSPLGLSVPRRVTPGADAVILPLDLAPDAQGAVLAQVGDGARLVALGRRADARPDIAARADAILPVPVRGADLALALAGIPARTRPRLLLADDNAANRLLLDRMLRDQPYEIEIVQDGAAAVAAFRRAPADAVLLDISMPGLDGFAAAAAIAATEAGAGVPLLALTAHAGDDMADRLRAAGFAAHLAKPLGKDLLLAALAQSLAPQFNRTA